MTNQPTTPPLSAEDIALNNWLTESLELDGYFNTLRRYIEEGGQDE